MAPAPPAPGFRTAPVACLPAPGTPPPRSRSPLRPGWSGTGSTDWRLLPAHLRPWQRRQSRPSRQSGSSQRAGCDIGGCARLQNRARYQPCARGRAGRPIARPWSHGRPISARSPTIWHSGSVPAPMPAPEKPYPARLPACRCASSGSNRSPAAPVVPSGWSALSKCPAHWFRPPAPHRLWPTPAAAPVAAPDRRLPRPTHKRRWRRSAPSCPPPVTTTSICQYRDRRR